MFFTFLRHNIEPPVYVLVYRIFRKMQGRCLSFALYLIITGLVVCLQICLQSGQHRLKSPVTEKGYSTGKTRQSLMAEGIAQTTQNPVRLTPKR